MGLKDYHGSPFGPFTLFCILQPFTCRQESRFGSRLYEKSHPHCFGLPGGVLKTKQLSAFVLDTFISSMLDFDNISLVCLCFIRPFEPYTSLVETQSNSGSLPSLPSLPLLSKSWAPNWHAWFQQ